MVTICMKCQILFSRKNTINLSSVELAHNVVMVTVQLPMAADDIIFDVFFFLFYFSEKMRFEISCEFSA